MPNADVREAIARIHKDPGLFRLAVCVPSGDEWKASMGMSLAVMGVELCRTRIEGYSRQQVGFVNVRTSLIMQLRHTLVEKALIEFQATHLLFVDSDQVFPANAVHRLARPRKAVIGANIVTRKLPMVPCALGFDLKKLWTRPESTGLEEVASVGTGLCLVNTKVFADLDVPYFESYFSREANVFVGEDVDFCNKLRAKGHRIFVDHDLLKEIGHLGEFDYNFPVARGAGGSARCDEGGGVMPGNIANSSRKWKRLGPER